MSIRDIRDALRTRLETIPGIRVVDEIPGALTVTGAANAAVIARSPTTFPDTFDGTATRTFTVTVIVGKGAPDRVAIARLDDLAEFTGPLSVYAALQGPVLGAAHAVEVIGDSGIAAITVGTGPEAVDYVGCEFTVEAMVMTP